MAPDPTADAWMERALVSIARQGESDKQFASLISTMDFDIGAKDIEGIPLVNGGRVAKFNSEEDSEFTMELYSRQVGTSGLTSGAGSATGIRDLLVARDGSAPIALSTDYTRSKLRVSILWTNDSTATSATATTAANKSAVRYSFAEVYCTKVKPEFTDGILKETATFKLTPFDLSASANMKFESCAGASAGDKLPAMAGYTSTNKFG
jgi:hypothetical protein